MNRVALIFVIPALLLSGLGAAYYWWPAGTPAGEKAGSPRQFAQITLPWASEEKKAPAPKQATPAPAQRAQPAPAPAPRAQPAPTAPAPPAPDTNTDAAGPGWAVNCSSNSGEKGLTCRLSQTIVARQGGRTLTNVAFVLAPENKSPELVLQLPLGLYLPAGASYQVDQNAPQRLSIRTCDRNGCYARGAISPEFMRSVQQGKQLKVDFQNLAEEPISVPLSLSGFASAYAKIQTP